MTDGNVSCLSLINKMDVLNLSQLLENNSSYHNCTQTNETRFRGRIIDIFDRNGEIRIPLYVLIFILSVIGNALVILTLVQNRRMRTVTNVFLLNLSVSDLLLSVFCMPFTLIPQLMRNFIFGEVLCVAFRYLQAVSVTVSCFTLVTISTERYFAICHPLHSRRWQTLSHAYKIIVVIWIVALFITIPIAISCKLLPLKSGGKGCREIWADKTLEIVYSIGLVTVLLIIPLIVMALAYGCIAWRLWLDIRYQTPDKTGVLSDSPCKQNMAKFNRSLSCSETELHSLRSNNTSYTGNNGHISLRHSNFQNSVANRKRVIKMLVVVVLEYFICWTPLYIINTWIIVSYKTIHGRVSPLGWSLVLLLAYSSSFIHPITYCFLNKNFRKGFVTIFKCFIGDKPLSRSCTEFSSATTHIPLTPTINHKIREEYNYSKVSPDDPGKISPD